jgi:cytidylate kinase
MDRAVIPPPGVIELVGPAGVGKTTIRRLLAAQYGLTGRSVWYMPLPRLVASAVRLAPASLRLSLQAGTPAWAETKTMIRLDALFHLLQGVEGRITRGWVLDEGPAFVFGWLRTIGREAARPDQFGAWWQTEIARWRRVVNVIVILDACDAVLLKRIRTREKVHLLKTASDVEAVLFFDRYRAAYEATIADLTGGDGVRPDVVHLRTDEQSPEEIVAALAGRLNGRLHAR